MFFYPIDRSIVIKTSSPVKHIFISPINSKYSQFNSITFFLLDYLGIQSITYITLNIINYQLCTYLKEFSF